MNGNKEGDEEAEYTCPGGEKKTVTDHVIVYDDVRVKVKKLEITDYIDSYHFPIIVISE